MSLVVLSVLIIIMVVGIFRWRKALNPMTAIHAQGKKAWVNEHRDEWVNEDIFEDNIHQSFDLSFSFNFTGSDDD